MPPAATPGPAAATAAPASARPGPGPGGPGANHDGQKLEARAPGLNDAAEAPTQSSVPAPAGAPQPQCCVPGRRGAAGLAVLIELSSCHWHWPQPGCPRSAYNGARRRRRLGNLAAVPRPGNQSHESPPGRGTHGPVTAAVTGNHVTSHRRST